MLFLKFDLESLTIYGADAEKSLPLQYLLDNPLIKILCQNVKLEIQDKRFCLWNKALSSLMKVMMKVLTAVQLHSLKNTSLAILIFGKTTITKEHISSV